MQSLHDFIKFLNDVKEALLALASTLLLVITIWQIIWKKVRPEKKKD